jgi:hypothetical protein
MPYPFPEGGLTGGSGKSGLQETGDRSIVEIRNSGIGALGWTLDQEVLKGWRVPPLNLEVGRWNAKRFLGRKTERGQATCHPGWKLGNAGTGNRCTSLIIFPKQQGGHEELLPLPSDLSLPEIDADPGNPPLQGIHFQ